LLLLAFTGCEENIVATVTSTDKAIVKDGNGNHRTLTIVNVKCESGKQIVLGDDHAKREWKVDERYVITHGRRCTLGGFSLIDEVEKAEGQFVESAEKYQKQKLDKETAKKQKLADPGPITLKGPAEATTIAIEGESATVLAVDEKGSIKINSDGTVDTYHGDGHSEYGVKMKGPFYIKFAIKK
jgi:hypothetical protein